MIRTFSILPLVLLCSAPLIVGGRLVHKGAAGAGRSCPAALPQPRSLALAFGCRGAACLCGRHNGCSYRSDGSAAYEQRGLPPELFVASLMTCA